MSDTLCACVCFVYKCLTVDLFTIRLKRCSLWLKYGILKEEFVLISVNLIGTVLSVAYCYVFMKYAMNARSVYYQILGCACFLMSILVYVDCSDFDQADALEHIGKN